MKRMCFGTMLTLLYQSRSRKSDTIKAICGKIFEVFNIKINQYDKGLPSHLKRGHDSVPSDLVTAATNLPIEDIDRGFEELVVPSIHDNMRVALFRAIKDVLREDPELGTKLMGKATGYEKDNILAKNSFDESMLLANLTTYAILYTDNKFADSIKEINTNYVDSFVSSGEDIFFISPEINQDQCSPLKRTLKDPMFDRIFTKATDIVISEMSNPSKASIFYPDMMNCRFSFKELKGFIVNNIGNYVFSRAEINRITNTTKNQAAVGSWAMLKFIQKYGNNAESVLGEILLYIFLEQELNAPKIMSKIEVDGYHRNIVSKSDGIHLLSADCSGHPLHQLVFGASDIDGDLTEAVDRAFDKIIKIKANSDNELRMVESTTQWMIYDPEETKLMVELMIPQRGGRSKPDMAFSAFLGYTIKLDNLETNNQKYEIAIKKQLVKDIEAARPHIINLIVSNKMSGYSFYFYVMPFNDALNEKESIIIEMLGLGGGVN